MKRILNQRELRDVVAYKLRLEAGRLRATSTVEKRYYDMQLRIADERILRCKQKEAQYVVAHRLSESRNLLIA